MEKLAETLIKMPKALIRWALVHTKVLYSCSFSCRLGSTNFPVVLPSRFFPGIDDVLIGLLGGKIKFEK